MGKKGKIKLDEKKVIEKLHRRNFLRKVCFALLTFLLSLTVFINNVNCQQVSGDTLTADFKYFIKLLAETHPDPYTGFGGKVFFHKEASDIEQQLKNGTTLSEFTSLVLSFMSNLEDKHTSIDNIQSNADVANLRLPIEFMVIQDGLIVSKISKDKEKFIGSKFQSINGISLAELCKDLGKLRPMENIYGKYNWLSICIRSYRQMRSLLPDMQEKTSIILETLDGNTETIEFAYISVDSCANIEMTEIPKYSKIQDGFLFYDYLDQDKQAMYFKMPTVMAREPFTYMKENSWSQMENMLQNFYTYDLKKEMPANIDEAIADIPNLADIFRQMLEQMKKNNAKYLIIDLRDNRGGFTPIVYPTLYMLYGDSYLEKDMNVSLYRLISDLYLKKLNTTLEDFNNQNKTSYQIGDYLSLLEFDENIDLVERRRNLADNALGEASDYIKDLNGKPVYSPEKIFVITNQQTFSAAFHYAFYLWKMGATLIGVPSEQTPNAFMEVTPFQLPLTQIKGSISNSLQVFLPANDRRAKIFYPDIMLNWIDYEKYDFNKDSDLLYLLDFLKLKM